MNLLRAVLALALLPSVALAQAPSWAGLWRIASSTLTNPAALERGVIGTFWNPAAAAEQSGLSAGVAIVETPDIVGVGALLGGVSERVGPHVSVGALVGNISVNDLIRTTTSPSSVVGDIPVYSQFFGVLLGYHAGPFDIGATARAHHAAFDADRAGGVTTDIGIRVRPIPILALAASTQFASATFGQDPATDYFAGAELTVVTVHVWGAPTRLITRYGVQYRDPGGADQTFGLGVAFDGHLRIDGGLARERAFGLVSWRAALALAFHTGHYTIAIARADGLNDLGATYRIGLEVGALP